MAKINGKTVFVPYTLPGEELEVEITSTGKDYDTARITKILKPSPNRIEPVCPLYGKCGGCNMMHIKEETQEDLRKEVLKDLFSKAGVTLPEIEVIGGKNLGYRSRFQLTNGGLNERLSNNVINLESCPIAEDVINSYLKNTPITSRPRGRCHLFGSSHVESCGGDTSRKVIIADSETDKPKTSKVTKKTKNYKEAHKHYAGTVLNPNDIITVNILGRKISFNVKGFFQSNLEVLEKAIVKVCEGLVGESVLDMYAGCGTFSVFLTDFFPNLTLVEHNRDALVFAETNLQGKAHESIGLSGAKWVETQKINPKKFDAVVIDPPRSGMEREVLNYLCTSKIPQIRSVSCDPLTHARDAARLIKAGYKIEKVFLLDFYPNTCHIESLIYFTL